MAAVALITISSPRSTNGAPPSPYNILANMKQSRQKKKEIVECYSGGINGHFGFLIPHVLLSRSQGFSLNSIV